MGDPDKSHVVSALIKKFCDAVKNGENEVEVWGDGSQTRELIYVEDQIIGLLALIEYMDSVEWKGPELVNIGTGVETSIRDLAETIQKLSGFNGKINYNTDKFVGVRRKVLDISLADYLFGWTYDYGIHSLEEGIQKSIDWYVREVQK